MFGLLGQAVGYRAEGDYARSDEAIAKEMVALEATAKVASGVMAVEAMGGRGGSTSTSAQKALSGKGRIDPNKVRFMQDSISSDIRDKDGKSYPLDTFVKGLKDGTIKSENVEPIRIFEKDRQLYTLDNRRLQAYQEAGVQAPYRTATPDEIANNAWKFTTKNQGTSVIIRNSKK